MKHKFNVKWSRSVKIITLIVIVILTGAEASLVFIANNYSILLPIIFSIGLLSCISYCLYQAPKFVEINGEYLTMHTLGKKVQLKLSEIDTISPFQKGLEIRIFGSGGFCGYTGLFKNKQIGKYNSYVGEYQKAFYIKTKTEKQYVMSCENYTELLSFVNQYK